MKLSTILSSLFVSSLVALTKAEEYRVVVLPSEYGGSGVGVVVDNGTPVPMKQDINGMYWTVEANKPSTDYYYVILNENSVVYSEKANFNFQRKWTDGKNTLNQIFGKRYDRAGNLLKTIPRVAEARSGCKKFSKLFQEGEVPVIRFHLSDQDYTTLVQDDSNQTGKLNGSMDIFTPGEIFQFTNVTLELSGMGSRGFKKHPFKVSLSDNEADSKSNTEIYDRSSFKLRNMVYDPSYIKGKMTVDILTSLGVPAPQSAHARFYINNTPFGLYEFSETIKKKFVKNMFHTDEKKKDIKYGTLYKGVSLSDNGLKIPAFLYNDFPEYMDDLYSVAKKVVREGADQYDDIKEVLAWFDSLNEATPEKDIRAKFDVDVFFKGMAVEYLICQWDGYLQSGNNYYLYRNTDGFVTMFPFDFDLTYGKWCNFKQVPFEQFAQSQKDYGSKGKIYAQLYNKILNREPFKTQMKQVLDDTVSRLFNIQALGDRIGYFKEYLGDDIAWDINIRQTLPTQNFGHEEEEPIPDYDGVMALLSNNQTSTVHDYGIYNWIRDTSEYIAKTDNIKFDVSNKQGEVGGVIVSKKKNEVEVNGDLSSNAVSNYIVNTAALIFLSILIIF
jgi:spore coat protein CotH